MNQPATSQLRRARPIHFPAELPISERRAEIAAAIRDHQVIVLTGETGSGKTTQLPKICLDLGYGRRGRIGHTQPRRLAARTVAERIAAELGESIGETVGYQVRFTERVGDTTAVKVMTDGILLNEIQRDRMLRQYEVLIVDEAHERSLNIDFILGYLKRLLPRRPDLKLIITSATIDPERFAAHFDDAPIVEVSGRTYPVEVRYRPLVDPDRDDRERDQVQGILDAVDELIAEGPGDILVFCSGEREIRDAADALKSRRLRDTEVLPLYARLSAAEQHRVFERHRGRRIVLATNIAETSLTVPGIKYVIDPGTARISRYSQRLKVQRLPIEPVSQASADQRAGRCGRTSDGICIRLYSEEDYNSRPRFTEPEILRTNLASVLLAMLDLGLGDLADFPFIDPPDRRNIRAGLDLLVELGAISPDQRKGRPRRLTKIGKRLARLPLDPRLGRMLLEADRNGALREVLIIVSALSIQDPRERPVDQEQAADAKHARFADPDSDFQAYLNLWNYLRERRRELSGNQFRRMCRDEYLHYLRVREWQDVHTQLRQICRDLGMRLNSAPARPEEITRSILAGLLSHVGLRDPDTRDYQGARGARFAIFPGSGLFKKPPSWVVAAELVETSRLWARENARIDPAWVEALAGHLVKRTYSEPHWERKRGAVVAYETVTLFGIPLAERRPVVYSKIEPELCRDLFIRHALVEGDWETRHRFFHANRALLDEVEGLEDRIRRRDLRVDDETLFDFYDERIGAEVVSAAHFDAWWKRVRRDQPDLLDFEGELVLRAEPEAIEEAFPDEWRHDDLAMPLTYVFDPGSERDGVTVDVPLAQLNQVDAGDFWWQVPGHREELVTALIRSLPKRWRRQLVPAPDHAREVVRHLTPGAQPLPEAVAEQLRRLTGVEVPADAFELDKLPDHLRIGFRIVDGDEVVAEGKDLDELRERLRPRLRSALADAAAQVERDRITAWEIGTLPREVTAQQGRQSVRGFPALVDEGDHVAVRVLESPEEQRRAMVAGTRRLLALTIGSPAAGVARRLDNRSKLALAAGPYASVPALLDDCAAAAIDHLVDAAGGVAWDAAGFRRLRDRVRADLHDLTYEITTDVATALELAAEVRRRVDALDQKRHGPVVEDMRAQLSWMIYDGFVVETGRDRLRHLPRYLRAMQRRLDRLNADPYRDDQRMLEVQAVEDAYDQLVDRLPAHRRLDPDVVDVRWSIEELRVSLFAQVLGTDRPVSAKRIRAAIDAIQP